MFVPTTRLRWATALLALLLPFSISADSSPQQAAAQAWTGTITVDEDAAGNWAPGGPGRPSLGFTGHMSSTYTLQGDGTVTWTGSLNNSIDMGGYYTIPTRGSGSGVGTSSVEFTGDGWDIGVESDDDFVTHTDYSAQDRVMATQVFGFLVEIAKALGQNVDLNATHIEEGRQGPAPAAVTVPGAENASTLTGSKTVTIPDASRIGGFPGVPQTITVRWNLRKAPVTPHVKIYGPECGCLDSDATEKSVHFIAGAAPAGGEFSEFVVKSKGRMPEIVSNNGGEHPSLDLTGTKETGEVTLTIVYTRNGVRMTSAPFVMNFCAIDKIALKDDDHDLAFGLDGRLIVDATAKLWRGGRPVPGELEWEIDRMSEPTSLEAEPSSRAGDHITFTYVHMPRRNADFGRKTLTAKTKGACACQRKETIRAFYPDLDSNHPDDASPNWYYYWKQTPAVPPLARAWLTYQDSIDDPYQPGHPIARYDHATQKILISSLVFGPSSCRDEVTPGTDAKTGRHAQGIDCFAETVRHELQHRTDAIDWWGSPAGPYGVSLPDWFLNDWDHDLVPNEVETLLAGCKPGTKIDLAVDVLKLLTLAEKNDLIERGKRTWFTCAQRPFQDATDAEINAYWKGWTWPIGSVDADDWSCGDLSKQWKGKKCGQ